MDGIVVRRITPDDGALLRQIRLDALADMPGAFSARLAEAELLTRERWEELAARNSSGSNQAIWLAPPPEGSEGAAVGILAAFRTLDDVVTLTSLWAAPGYRRIGVAEALVAEATGWARGSDSRQLRIWVMEANLDAREFYEKLGFETTGASMSYEPDPRLSSIEYRLPLSGATDTPR